LLLGPTYHACLPACLPACLLPSMPASKPLPLPHCVPPLPPSLLSVTLFEGGRVYGADVINELIEELHTSVEMSAGFEGEMKSLVAYARSAAAPTQQACATG
jgi:hypothetical protein